MKRKEYNMMVRTSYIKDISPTESCHSLSRHIPIPFIYLSNEDASRNLVNKSARLSHDLVFKMSISLLCCNS